MNLSKILYDKTKDIKVGDVLTGGKNFIKNTIQNKPKVITPDERMYAILADNSYKKEKKPVDNHDFLGSFNDNLDVYRKDNNKYVFSHRGTNNLNDVMTDIKLAKGEIKSSKRFNDTDNFVNSFMKKHPEAEITHTGHSLGGSVAAEIGKKYNQKSIGFNSGTVKPNFNSNHMEIKTRDDPTSFLSIFGNNTKIIPDKSGHSINNFVNW